ncbi:MAG TPA: transglycosylase domain-containing protein [Elusimicrobiota bacterium]|nr:transglycosylase domain-containing protein [Elusimicrobiota bacterium]
MKLWELIKKSWENHRFVLVFSVLYCVLSIWMAILFRRYLGELPPVNQLEGYIPSLITKIYDVHGDLITELFVERRSVVPLTQIPLDFQRATLAIEDSNFYEHWGVDVKGILRAFLSNLRARRAAQGGSTIPQQLSKTIFLTRTKTYERKIKELILTLQMERYFSKDEILQLYLNQIYYGNGAYGVEAASRVYFGKHVGELTLGECALLAGLPRAPQYYSPFDHPKRALLRRAVVLNRMREMGFITEKEALQAIGQSMQIRKVPLTPQQAAYFVEHVRLELEPRYGSTALYRGGLSIYTTLDLRIQKAAEETTAQHLSSFDEQHAEKRLLYLLKNKKIDAAYYNKWRRWMDKKARGDEVEDIVWEEPTPVQGGLVAIDPPTGGIRALIGGRDFQKSQFNRATQAKRQPGSTFKPFVWLAALESGFSPSTIVDDYPIAYANVERHPELVVETTSYDLLQIAVTGYYTPDRDPKAPDPIWAPKNWDDKYLGPVTLRKGLSLSRNLVSVRLIDRVGPRTVIDVAQKSGIRSKLDPVLSLSLGSSVVTILEIVSAFSTFANNGVHMDPYSVEKVVDADGRILEEHLPQAQMSFSPQMNYLISHLMEMVVKEGTARHARLLGRAAAGKTGTTQDMRDVWFIGYTPDLVTGVWVGYDDFVPLGKKITSAGTTVPWWTDFMAGALKPMPPRDFDVPPGIVFAKICADSGFLSMPSCPHTTLEAFLKDKVPQDFCKTDHRKFFFMTPALEITE